MTSKFEIFIDVFIGIFLIIGLIAPLSSDTGISSQAISGSAFGYKLPGKPTEQQVQECQKNGGKIYCGNGWCYCTLHTPTTSTTTTQITTTTSIAI